MGEGVSIPFMGALADMFPRAKFVVTGVLGPNSNAHSANEFLHIPFMKKMMCCLGVLLAEHGKRVPSN
jgi:acetylornithine deacetylase/succinyl-diaminopimelate desuccinylase-like protein